MNTQTKCPELVESLDWVIYFCKAGNRPRIPEHNKLKKACKGKYAGCHYYVERELYALKAKNQGCAGYADMPPVSRNFINHPASKPVQVKGVH
ncbi:MAG: hypothetical protein OEU95_07620 [Nitrospirota bacterium]|nr:hypothetical protein [Nitrospirota bacterium]